jgi:hypothetical protein
MRWRNRTFIAIRPAELGTGDIQHPASATDLGPNSAEHKPGEHRRHAQPPHQCADQQRRQDDSHKYSAENVHHPPRA